MAFIARNRNLLAIEQHGFRLIEDDGRELHAPRVRAYADGSEAGPQDAVLLAVKAHQVKDVLPAMQGLLGPETAVVTMSNGLPWWYFQRLPGPLREPGAGERRPGRRDRRGDRSRAGDRQRRLPRRRAGRAGQGAR